MRTRHLPVVVLFVALALCPLTLTAGGDQADLRGKLAFDMQLNAQGLRLWRQRSVSQASATGLAAD